MSLRGVLANIGSGIECDMNIKDICHYYQTERKVKIKIFNLKTS